MQLAAAQRVRFVAVGFHDGDQMEGGVNVELDVLLWPGTCDLVSGIEGIGQASWEVSSLRGR